MRKAKEVKVINRWKADEFNGEIPIGGGDEMLGTAMKMANGMGQLGDLAENSKAVVRPLSWLALYGGGGYVIGNTAMAYFGDSVVEADVDARRMLYRLTYLGTASLVSLWANGLPSGYGESIRAGGVGIASAALAARRTIPDPGAGHASPTRTNLLRVGLAGYGIASASLLITKAMEKFS
jgi:hypothetical protein